MGVNYDHDAKGLLLEDYWDSEWERVVEDLSEIAELGFNTVRIHLQLHRYMSGPAAIRAESFERLERLVERAAKLGLYVDLTGLAHYRKADIPPWFLALDDEQMAAAEAELWREVAERFQAEPAVFCYDLQNEPVLAWEDTQEVVGPAFVGREGTYHFINLHDRAVSEHWTRWLRAKFADEGALTKSWPDFPRPGESFAAILLPGILDEARNRTFHEFAAERARQWTQRMVAAIREHDRRHLITIGSLPGVLPFLDTHYSPFSPHNVGDLLDFVAIHLHVWGRSEEDDEIAAEMVLRAADIGKPVLVEEFSILLPPERTERFMARSQHSTAGYLGYHWGEMPAELRASGAIHDGIAADHVELLAGLARELHGRTFQRRPGDVTLAESIVELRLSADRRRKLRAAFAEHVAADRYVDFELGP